MTNSKFSKKIEQLLKIQPDVFNEFQAWTPLKLILLNYALDVCTPIIANLIKEDKIFKKMYFVDLFAGSGINKLKGKADFLIGSPLIASLNYGSVYTKMYFSEWDIKHPELSNALEVRIASLKNPCLIVNKQPYNAVLQNITKVTGEHMAYSLFFIDPHCMEFEWKDMRQVLNKGNDIVFTLMTGEIIRTIGLVNAGISNGACLTTFFGDESWRSIKTTEDIVTVYSSNICKARKYAVIRAIKIQSAKHGFCYHMLFITNRTSKGSPWVKAIDKAKEEIESNSDVAVEMALDILKKRQSQLSSFE